MALRQLNSKTGVWGARHVAPRELRFGFEIACAWVRRLVYYAGGVRIWWNWQTRYFEVVVGQPVQVQVLLCAPLFQVKMTFLMFLTQF